MLRNHLIFQIRGETDMALFANNFNAKDAHMRSGWSGKYFLTGGLQPILTFCFNNNMRQRFNFTKWDLGYYNSRMMRKIFHFRTVDPVKDFYVNFENIRGTIQHQWWSIYFQGFMILININLNLEWIKMKKINREL